MSGLGATPRLLALDFDGVLTDNTVWIDEVGSEMVRCDRSDGLGLRMVLEAGIGVTVLSSEPSPVVPARCSKLGVECRHGLSDKRAELERIMRENRLRPDEVVYVGNDVNDLGCMRLAGTAVAVRDAHPQALQIADLVLERSGGHGAVRELCDLLLEGLVTGAIA